MDEEGRTQILLEQVLAQVEATNEGVRDLLVRAPRIEATLDDHSAQMKEIRMILGGQMERTTALEVIAHSH